MLHHFAAFFTSVAATSHPCFQVPLWLLLFLEVLHHHWLCSLSLSLFQFSPWSVTISLLSRLPLCVGNSAPVGTQVRCWRSQVCCTICSRIFHLGGSNIAPMFSGPTLSDVLQFSSWRCCITILLLFCFKRFSPGFRELADFRCVASRCHSSVFLLVAAAPHPWNLLLASSDVQPLEMCCITISLSRFSPWCRSTPMARRDMVMVGFQIGLVHLSVATPHPWR